MERFLPLLNKAKVVMGLAPTTPSTSTPDYVCMKGYQKCTAIIAVDNIHLAITTNDSAVQVVKIVPLPP